MNAQHTPGPWEMRGPCEIKGNYSVVHNGPLFYVGDAGQPEGTGKANARLAAAAPDLLAALQAILTGNVYGDPDEWNRRVDLGFAAIAKATGEAR